MSMAARSAVVGHLLLARHHAGLALESLSTDEEYLRGELEKHLEGIQSLLGKMEREEALVRDRDYLQADLADSGLGEWIGGTDE